MVKESKDYIVVDFTGLIKRLFNKWWIMFLSAFICGCIAAGGAYAMSLYRPSTPMYTSTVKLYVTANYTDSLSTSVKTLGQSYISDYYELMRSQVVLEQVNEDLNLQMKISDLKSSISKSQVANTSMMSVSVRMPEPELAKAIVDDLVVVTSAYALEILGMNPPMIYEAAQVPKNPSVFLNQISKKTIAIYGALAGGVASFVVLVVLYLLDNKVRKASHIEDYSNMNLLTLAYTAKKKKSAGYNKAAMKIFYEKLYANSKDNKKIAFVSGSREDKAYVVKEFAKFLFAIDKKVIFLDANLVEQKKLKKGEVREIGLVDYLTDEKMDLKDVLVNGEKYDKIVSGGTAMNSIELLSGERFAKLVDALAKDYDYVLISTTETDVSEEAKVVMDMADVNVAIVEIGTTKLVDMREFSEKFNSNNELFGVVLSNIKFSDSSAKKEFGKYFNV